MCSRGRGEGRGEVFVGHDAECRISANGCCYLFVRGTGLPVFPLRVHIDSGRELLSLVCVYACLCIRRNLPRGVNVGHSAGNECVSYSLVFVCVCAFAAHLFFPPKQSTENSRNSLHAGVRTETFHVVLNRGVSHHHLSQDWTGVLVLQI